MKKRENIKSRGIILGSKTLGETDKLLFILTRDHGKIKAMAKGALKPTSKFSGKTETLNTYTFDLYRSPNNTILIDVKEEKCHSSLRENLEKVTNALVIAKLLDNLLLEEESIQNTNTREIFNLVEETLKELAKAKTKPLLITTTFLVKLLGHLGLLPNPQEIKGKYKKLFNYLKKEQLSKIKKILLTEQETVELKTLVKNIIETETEKALTIPF